MKIEALLALLRHGLTTFGGVLVTGGMATSDEVATAAGWIVGLLGMGWSLWRKHNNKARRT